MKTSRTLAKILSVALILAMVLSLASCGLFGGSLKLESFTVDRSSVKTSYYIGEEIDFSGIKAVAKYSDSSLDKEYTAADLTVTYDPDITATVGQKEVKVSFQDPNLNCEQSTTVAITVSEDPNVVRHESYKIDATNVKTNYHVGETVDLTGLKLYDVMNNKSEVEITDSAAALEGVVSADNAVQIITDSASIFLPLSDIIDTEKEIARLEGEQKKLLSEIERLEKKLSNEGFVAKAPAAVIEGEKAKLAKYKENLEGVVSALAKMR